MRVLLGQVSSVFGLRGSVDRVCVCVCALALRRHGDKLKEGITWFVAGIAV